ncbi:Threonine/homoserine efflux transporter RhtA [Alkalispirochaeta americana]|uniref:Threonine/homoserine efflux transporter RhtA n=1 Tax=Alkalispirochaeta americana TaxID=159291 RepID=A0A1N6TJ27_9SPIO|nr:DMT family transporter [Alkalispirochaeta americana]SIQ53271.1 Threonine/homoserine efflux transporter RhtA [Alkalispirochaeta americana]
MIVHLAMLTTMILWGVSFVASKLVLEEISPLTYMGIRFLLASLLLAGVMILRGRPRFSRKTHGLIALTALAEPVAYFLFETFGLNLLSPSIASLIIATTPLAVMVLAAAFLQEPLSTRGITAVFLSIGGIALLVLGNGNSGALGTPDPRQLLGIALIFGAVISAACYITLARNLTQRHDPVNLTVIQTWWGAGVFFLLWRLQPPLLRTLSLSPLGWGAVIFLAAGATVLAFLLYNWALRYETAGRAALYINAIPVITAITSWFVLGERLSPIQGAGAVLVLLAVRFSSHRKEVLIVPPEG